MTSSGLSVLSHGKNWNEFEIQTGVNIQTNLVRKSLYVVNHQSDKTSQIKELAINEFNALSQKIQNNQFDLLNLPQQVRLINTNAALADAFDFLVEYSDLINTVDEFSNSVLGREIVNQNDMEEDIPREREDIQRIFNEIKGVLEEKLESSKVDGSKIRQILKNTTLREDCQRLASYATVIHLLSIHAHVELKLVSTLFDYMTTNPSECKKLLEYPGLSTENLDKILTLYQVDPFQTKDTISSVLKSSDDFEVMIQFMDKFVKVDDFNPRLFTILIRILEFGKISPEDVTACLENIDQFIKSAKSNRQVKDALNRFLLIACPLDIVLEYDVSTISIDVINTYLNDLEIHFLLELLDVTNQNSSWIIEWEKTLNSNPQLRQGVIKYIENCVNKIGYYKKHPELSFEDKLLAFNEREKKALYDLSKQSIVIQQAVIDTLDLYPYPEEIKVLVHFFDKSFELGQLACQAYKLSPVVFSHLLQLDEKLDESQLINLLKLIKDNRSEIEQLVGLYELPKNRLGLIVKIFCDSSVDLRADLIKLAAFDPKSFLLLKTDPKNEDMNGFIHYIASSEANMRGFSALARGIWGHSMNASKIFQLFLEQDKGDFEWILRQAAEGYWDCCALLQMLDVKSQPEFKDFFNRYRTVIEATPSVKARQTWFYLAGLHVLWPKDVLEFAESMLKTGPKMPAELASNIVDLAIYSGVESAKQIIDLEEKYLENIPLSPDEMQLLEILNLPHSFEDEFISRLIKAPGIQSDLYRYILSNGIDDFARGVVKVHDDKIEPLRTELSIADPTLMTSKKRILHALVAHSQFELANWVAGVPIFEYSPQFDHFELLVTFLTILQSNNKKVIKVAKMLLSEGGDHQALMQLQFLSKHDAGALKAFNTRPVSKKRRLNQDVVHRVRGLYEASLSHPSKLLADLVTELDANNENTNSTEVSIAKFISKCIVMPEGGINLIALQDIMNLVNERRDPEEDNNPFIESLVVQLRNIGAARGDISTLLTRVKMPERKNPVYALLKKSTSEKLTPSYIREELMCALLIPLRQSKVVGSCFATQSAILMQSNGDRWMELLKDYLMILENGYIERSVQKDGIKVLAQYPVIVSKEIDLKSESALARTHEYTLTGLTGSYHFNQFVNRSKKFVLSFDTYPAANRSQFQGFIKDRFTIKFSEAFADKFYIKFDVGFPEGGSWRLYLKSNQKVIKDSLDYSKKLIEVLEETKQSLGKFKKSINFCDELIHALKKDRKGVMRFLINKANPKTVDAYDRMDTLEITPWYDKSGGNTYEVYLNSISHKSKLSQMHLTPTNVEQFFTGITNFITHLPYNVKSKISNNEQYRLAAGNKDHSYNLLPYMLLSKRLSTNEVLNEMKDSIEEFRNLVVPASVLKIFITTMADRFSEAAERFENQLNLKLAPVMTFENLFKVMHDELIRATADVKLASKMLNDAENIMRSLLDGHSLNVPALIPLVDTNYIHEAAQRAYVGFACSLSTAEIRLYDYGSSQGVLELTNLAQYTFEGIEDMISFYPAF